MVVVKPHFAKTARKGTHTPGVPNWATDTTLHKSNAWTAARLATPGEGKVFTKHRHYLKVQEGGSKYLCDMHPCTNMDAVQRYTKQLEPGIELQYIPMHEHWACYFMGNTLHHPNGPTLKWVSKGPRPDSTWQMC